jgi:hypothetical protein
MLRSFLILTTFCLLLNSCFLSTYYTREPALVKNANIDETIKIAKDELQKEGISQSLGIWVMRDQVVTPEQARTIADLYLTHIDSMKIPFNIWHSSWAISNLYRLGDAAVKVEMETAYQKAKKQPERLTGGVKNIANYHINGDKIVSGFIHFGGRGYARGHLVAPGNKRYIQSYDAYCKKKKKKK